jgi:hypothetical protein
LLTVGTFFPLERIAELYHTSSSLWLSLAAALGNIDPTPGKPPGFAPGGLGAGCRADSHPDAPKPKGQYCWRTSKC